MRFLKWCYTGEYPDRLEEWDSICPSRPKIHIAVYLLADFLGAEGLQKQAAHKYYQSECDFLCHDFIESVRLVFGNTVKRKDQLRQRVLEIAVWSHATMKDTVLTEYELLLFEVDEFAACLALEL